LIDHGDTFAYLGGQHSYHEPRASCNIWVSTVVVMAIHVEIMSIDFGQLVLQLSRLRIGFLLFVWFAKPGVRGYMVNLLNS